MSESGAEIKAPAARVRGAVIGSHLAYVAERWGEAKKQRLLARFSLVERKRLEGVARDGDWFDYDQLRAIDTAIASDLADGDAEIFAALGRASAEYNLKRVLAAQTSSLEPAAMLTRVAKMHLFQDFGAGHAEDVETEGEDGGVALVYTYATDVDPFYCASSVAFYGRLVELLGFTDVRAVESTCQSRGDAEHRFEIRWSPAAEEEPAEGSGALEFEADSEEEREYSPGPLAAMPGPDVESIYREERARNPDDFMSVVKPSREIAALKGLKVRTAALIGATVLVAGFAVWEVVTSWNEAPSAPPVADVVHPYNCSGALPMTFAYDKPYLRFSPGAELTNGVIALHQGGRDYVYTVSRLAANSAFELDVAAFAASDGGHPDPATVPSFVTMKGTSGSAATSCECHPR